MIGLGGDASVCPVLPAGAARRFAARVSGLASGLALAVRPAESAGSGAQGRSTAQLREIIRDYEDGQITNSKGYTVALAVRDWLQFGMSGRGESTIAKCAILANAHLIPALGGRKLRELSADDVDRWLADNARSS